MGLPITGAGGAGGNGGAVTVNLNGSIETGSAKVLGESSPGILAQSVGGGGGIAGYTAINPVGLPNLIDVFRGTFMGSGNSGGTAGPVSITSAMVTSRPGVLPRTASWRRAQGAQNPRASQPSPAQAAR